MVDLEITNTAEKSWKLSEIRLVLEGIRKLQKVPGWSDADFKNAMTTRGIYTVFLYRTDKLEPSWKRVFELTSPPSLSNTITVTFNDAAFKSANQAVLTMR